MNGYNVNDVKMWNKSRRNLVKDDNGDLVDSNNILNRQKIIFLYSYLWFI
jgi:hypothetical protein